MRIRPETMGTVALVGSYALLGSTSVDAAPRRPQLPMPRWCVSHVASLEAQQATQLLQQVLQQWQEVESFAASSPMSGDFIFDMVDPETLALAPAIAEYDAAYSLEWDDEPHPILHVDDVDLEIFPLQAADA